FTSGHQAVIGIQPNAASPTNSDLRLYSSISNSSSTIAYNQGFTVSAQVGNFATQSGSNFSGEVGAAIFNASNQFVEFVKVLTGV
ncbi:hypothetical protein, partial [Umezakia ovalisporum]|uniref:hypothetical protein n=1 Tax=Umezakia ovalisporum TaxID=75695 RepID=UPI0039C64058